MYSGREQIYGNLQALIAALPGVQAVTRRVLTFDKVKSFTTTPLVIIEEPLERPRQGEGNVRYWWRLDVNLIVFNNIGQDPDLKVTPMTGVNTVLDQLETTLQPDTEGGVLTLGGVVFNCFFRENGIEKRQNGTDGWACAIVPLTLEMVTF